MHMFLIHDKDINAGNLIQKQYELGVYILNLSK